MNKHLKIASAVGALMLASAQAFAAPPTIPSGPLPEASGPFPTAPDGGLFVAVYDDTLNVSLVQYLGFKYSDFTPSLVTPESGGVANFGTLDGWSMFSGETTNTNIKYEVFAIQNNGGNFTDRSILFTHSGAAP